MRVDQRRAGCAGRGALGEEERVARRLEPARREAAARERPLEEFDVADDVGPIGRDVRDGEQVGQLGDDGALIRRGPRLDLRANVGGCRAGRRLEEEEREETRS
jgi:hypothetical protein